MFDVAGVHCLAGWTFHVEEISASVYTVFATSVSGASIEDTGTDLADLRARIRSETTLLSAQT